MELQAIAACANDAYIEGQPQQLRRQQWAVYIYGTYSPMPDNTGRDLQFAEQRQLDGQQ